MDSYITFLFCPFLFFQFYLSNTPYHHTLFSSCTPFFTLSMVKSLHGRLHKAKCDSERLITWDLILRLAYILIHLVLSLNSTLFLLPFYSNVLPYQTINMNEQTFKFSIIFLNFLLFLLHGFFILSVPVEDYLFG